MFLNDWKETGLEGLKSDFWGGWGMRDDEKYEGQLDGAEILLASYSYQNYSGDAFVLFRKDGKLYEVNGSHCSCYGLEGQWKPEETSLAEIAHRLEAGSLGANDYCGNEFAKELREVLSKPAAEKEGE